MFSGCFQDAPMGIVGWWNLMIISNERMDFNGPKELDDPQLFDGQLEVWTLIIQKSTVIPPSLMVLFDIYIQNAFVRCVQSFHLKYFF